MPARLRLLRTDQAKAQTRDSGSAGTVAGAGGWRCLGMVATAEKEGGEVIIDFDSNSGRIGPFWWLNASTAKTELHNATYNGSLHYV